MVITVNHANGISYFLFSFFAHRTSQARAHTHTHTEVRHVSDWTINR